MNFTRKIQKALEPRTYTQSKLVRLLKAPRARFSEWRESRVKDRVRSRAARMTTERLLRGIDQAELQRIRAQYSAMGERPDVFWTKYLDVEKWLKLNVRYAKDYGLIARRPRRVLDLGCGGGYFLLVCRKLGSRTVGIDLDKDRVLNEMIAVFKLKRVVAEIRAFVPLPTFWRNFDLITAFMICFNYPSDRPAWGVPEWDFFLHDVSRKLTRRGRVILGLNRDLTDGSLYTDEVKSYFERRGGAIDGKRVVFSRSELIRTERGAVAA